MWVLREGGCEREAVAQQGTAGMGELLEAGQAVPRTSWIGEEGERVSVLQAGVALSVTVCEAEALRAAA